MMKPAEPWQEADACKSFYEALRILKKQVESGVPPPSSGYFRADATCTCNSCSERKINARSELLPR
jgi:hypothetical protein